MTSEPAWRFPAVLALLCALVPFIAAVGSFVISAFLGLVPWCWPMLEGCSSISRAARGEPAIFLFRLLMLPQAVLLIALWLAVRSWLRQKQLGEGPALGVLLCGGVGAVALGLYVDFLGSSGELYQLMRRFGITFHFAGTGLAQLLTVYLLRRRQAPQTRPQRWMWYFTVGEWALAMLHVVLKATLNDDAWENRLEWSLALMMVLWFVALAWQFRAEGLTLQRLTKP